MLTQTIQLYENRPHVTLTTYLWSDSPVLQNGRKRPAVLICPGGAYLICSDREAEPVALRFAAMGYHAFVLRYSTYSEGAPFILPLSGEAQNLPVNPQCVHPAPMRDLAKAFLVIREHAEKWLVDAEKIILCGFSAGAHNCAMYAVYWHTPIIHEFFGKEPEAFKPAAAILAYGLYDYHLMMRERADPLARAISEAANIAFFGAKSPTKEMLDAASPALHVSRHTPPIFLWATATDELVPVENTTRMAHALAQAGAPFEVHIFEEGRHGLSLANQASAESLLEMNPDVEPWIDLAEAWLKKRFALTLPPQPAWLGA
ncbi:alpha/beta hydrolase [Caldilinea sp.]|uniref:alpha/beta hydrolase n=1 Tax=Caldilinea sp. TaxID=2293560 RepID=UPI0021DC1F97|nr:alpha/beta hydrolase [Caldilinea sp.]GIV69426.1 MAG: acetylesterase [Caldilinea sp.]